MSDQTHAQLNQQLMLDVAAHDLSRQTQQFLRGSFVGAAAQASRKCSGQVGKDQQAKLAQAI